MQMKIEMMTKWLRDSGLKVNTSKTETCLFYRIDHTLLTLSLDGIEVRSKSTFNIL
jgi:hypothetical protein